MRDLDIRLVLKRDLAMTHLGESETLILDELGLLQGHSRVDVAVVNGSLNGYEIKSEKDTLVRLAGQAEVYNRTLDSVTIVVSGSHLDQVVMLIPDWWGIQEAMAAPDGGVELVTRRSANPNPGVDPYALVQLLWRDEALDALKERGLERGLLSKPRQALWDALASSLELDELKDLVRCRLKARANWRSAEQRV